MTGIVPPYKLFALGDSAITVDFGNYIDIEINKIVLDRFHQLIEAKLEGVIEIIPSYSSMTILYDLAALSQKQRPGETIFELVKTNLESFLGKPVANNPEQKTLIKIPVCYESAYAPDLDNICAQKKISAEELIEIHTAAIYRIFMLGFLPGFAYMGEVDQKIACARKNAPEQVVAGSVGIAGKQTGIYPLDSPGGWQIIGRTPLKLFDPAKEQPVLLKAGDNVQFFQVNNNEFKDYQSRNS
jgi:inhibitor of KinA